MRQILFRAKRIDNGEWVYGNYAFADVCGGHHFIFQNKPFEHEVDENTICQYTGLTDKNGNKIWENDVVEIPGEDDCFKVMWSDAEARCEMQSDSLVVDFDNYWSYEVEVIGNIFDNACIAELLKGEEG